MSGKQKYPVETPQEWLRYAEGDLRVAERELLSSSPVHPTVCFLCQSASEKFLKGFLISQGWSLEKTHDVVELLALCTDYDTELGGMVAEGAILNEYIIAGRYPGDIASEPIGSAEAKEALKAAQTIRGRISYLMKGSEV